MVGIVTPLLIAEGINGLAVGIGIATVIAMAGRVWFLSRLFPSFQILVHSARAIAPTVPATAAVLLVRGATDIERTPGVAIGEFALYVAVTVLATWAFERPLLRELRGYLRRDDAVVGAATLRS